MKENIRIPEAPGEPSFKFVYALHDGPVNGKKTWNELKDCDVILLEEIGQTEEQKVRSEKAIENATNNRWTIGGFFDRMNYTSKEMNGWGRYIISQAIKTGKEFYYVDIRGESPVHGLEEDARLVYCSAFEAFREGNAEGALHLLSEGVDKFVLFNSERTREIIRQIEALYTAGKLKGKRVGIAQGAGHMATYQTFQRKYPGFQTEHAAVLPKDWSFLILNAMVKREMNPYGDIDRRDLMDMLLSTGVLYPYLCARWPKDNPAKLNFTADNLVKNLDIHEIGLYWKIATEPAKDKNDRTSKFLRVAYAMAINHGLEKPALKYG